MKKACFIILAFLVMCTSVACALAEEAKKGTIESIGAFFSDAWNNVSDWVDTAINDTSAWIESAWGDASTWIDKTWNDTATWATEIWGDASTWTEKSFNSASESVSIWWTETFSAVTDTSQKVWDWVKEDVSLSTDSIVYMKQIKAVISLNGDEASNQVKALFYELLGKVNIVEKEADRIWQTINAYATSRGLSQLSTEKLSLPYLFKLAMDEQLETSRSIPAIAVAQYLTGIYEKLGVQSDDIADKLLVSLTEVLGNIINQ